MVTLHPKEGIELLVYPVQKDAHAFYVTTDNNLTYVYDDGGIPRRAVIPLSPGNYLFIATTKSITEEQAAELVERVSSYQIFKTYKDYSGNGWELNAIESLNILFEMAGLDPSTKNYAILKRENQ